MSKISRALAFLSNLDGILLGVTLLLLSTPIVVFFHSNATQSALTLGVILIAATLLSWYSVKRFSKDKLDGLFLNFPLRIFCLLLISGAVIFSFQVNKTQPIQIEEVSKIQSESDSHCSRVRKGLISQFKNLSTKLSKPEIPKPWPQHPDKFLSILETTNCEPDESVEAEFAKAKEIYEEKRQELSDRGALANIPEQSNIISKASTEQNQINEDDVDINTDQPNPQFDVSAALDGVYTFEDLEQILNDLEGDGEETTLETKVKVVKDSWGPLFPVILRLFGFGKTEYETVERFLLTQGESKTPEEVWQEAKKQFPDSDKELLAIAILELIERSDLSPQKRQALRDYIVGQQDTTSQRREQIIKDHCESLLKESYPRKISVQPRHREAVKKCVEDSNLSETIKQTALDRLREAIYRD